VPLVTLVSSTGVPGFTATSSTTATLVRAVSECAVMADVIVVVSTLSVPPATNVTVELTGSPSAAALVAGRLRTVVAAA